MPLIPAGGDMRILIVNDKADERKLLRSVLAKHGCDITEAASCEEGVRLAGEINPSLIICGYPMPVMGSLQMLHVVRKDPLLRRITFIFHGDAFTDKKDAELALTLGADAIIVKPEVPEEFWPDLCAALGNSAPRNISEKGGTPADCELPFRIGQQILGRVEEKSVELEKAREEMAQCDKRYQRLLESVTDYMYTVRFEDGRYLGTTHGPGSVAVTGYAPEEFDADPGLCFRMIHDEEREYVRELTSRFASEKESILPFQHRILHKDGRVRWIRNTPVPVYDSDGRLVSYDGLIADITEYKKLEDQFRHAQKMEAVGVLAGGIAHDFNNILTAIIGYGNILLTQLLHDDSARNNIEQILVAAEKAANLVHGLLAFSRKQVINPKPVDLNKIINNVEKLLSRLITEDIELQVKLSEGEATIMADPGQIDQILMNLVTNARDAMPKGGVLTIETTVMEMDMDFLTEHGYGTHGSYVQVSISDTGMGMDEQARQRIFEPFFTTKPTGRGTGLGLSIIYGIVKQHNGFIDLQSRPNVGTTFRIYFPLIEARVSEPARPTLIHSTGENQTILIADDDPQVRAVISIILNKSGYKVIEAEDGEMAVREFGKNMREIDLLILDIVMPRKNGKEAYDEIRKLRPDVKVIFISGYTADVIDQKGVGQEELNIVAKPVSPYELLLKIKETLNN
jgi:PAS domain S-box-containing protein